MTLFKPSQLGFSITELLVGTVLAGAVAAGGGYVIYKANEQSFTASWQTQLNSEHLLSIQRAKDTNRLAQLLNLRTPQAESCFAKKSSANNCASLSVTEWRPLNDPGNNCGADCAFDKRVQYKVNCTANQCDGVYLQISTDLNPNFAQSRRVSAAKREAMIHIPGNMFASRKQLDFRCTSGNRFVSEVSFDSLAANCEQFTGATSCSSSNPLQNFGGNAPSASCQQMLQNGNCGYGFSQLGVFNGQAGCNTGGGGITVITPITGPGGVCSYNFSNCRCGTNDKVVTITATGASCPYANGQSVMCTAAEMAGRCPAGGVCPNGTSQTGLGGALSSPNQACKCLLANTHWEVSTATCEPNSTTSCTPSYADSGAYSFTLPNSNPAKTCYCPTGGFREDGAGDPNGTYSGCKCPQQGSFVLNDRCEDPCPATTSNATANTGDAHPQRAVCRCPANQTFVAETLGGGACRSCPATSFRIDANPAPAGGAVPGFNNKCKCGTNHNWNATTQRCEPVINQPPSKQTCCLASRTCRDSGRTNSDGSHIADCSPWVKQPVSDVTYTECRDRGGFNSTAITHVNPSDPIPNTGMVWYPNPGQNCTFTLLGDVPTCTNSQANDVENNVRYVGGEAYDCFFHGGEQVFRYTCSNGDSGQYSVSHDPFRATSEQNQQWNTNPTLAPIVNNYSSQAELLQAHSDICGEAPVGACTMYVFAGGAFEAVPADNGRRMSESECWTTYCAGACPGRNGCGSGYETSCTWNP